MRGYLSQEHLAMLTASGLTQEVIDARGYRTVTDANVLYSLGFKSLQARVPGLLIPIFTPDGHNGLYRFRPDVPRSQDEKAKGKRGDGTYAQKIIKYEQPAGRSLRLDCNPLARPSLGLAANPIFFVEGEKKADSLVARGQCAIALPGVWGFKSGNTFNDADFDYIALRGRTVYIAFDSDVVLKPNVSQAEMRLAEHLRRKGAEVRFIRLPSAANGDKQGVDDWLAAGHTVDELLLLSREHVRTLSQSFSATTADELAGIKINDRHMRDISRDALRELARWNNPPMIFMRGGKLARVLNNEHAEPRVDEMNEAAVRGFMARTANYFTERERDGQMFFTPADPPLDIVRDLLAIGHWPFPALKSIIECPALRPDGTIIDRPGYDPDTGIFYQPADGLQVPAIPASPSPADIRAALCLFQEMLCDFPFVEDTDYANMLGALLTPLLRPAILGTVPLALLDAPQAGTGKGLAAALVGILATGHEPAIITAPRDDDEWRKQITSKLLEGAPVITIDNLTGVLYSGKLAAVLTTQFWSDRRLGSTEMVTVPNRAVWLATGNNVQLGGDMPRRCYQVRIDAKMSRPWMRSDFRHSNILLWAMEHRGELVAAALTLARAWYVAGCPIGANPIVGSYTEWCQKVGGILATAGVGGFLGNLTEMYDRADVDGPQWETFLLGLHARFGGSDTKVSDICNRMIGDPELVDISPEMLEEPLDDKGAVRAKYRTRLGKELGKRVGMRYGDSQIRVERSKTEHSAKMWRLMIGGGGEVGEVVSPSVRDHLNDINLNDELNDMDAGADQPPQPPHLPGLEGGEL